METKTLHGVFVIVSTGRVEAGGGDKKLWGGILELQTKVRRRFEKITQSLRRLLQEPFPGCKFLLELSHFRHMLNKRQPTVSRCEIGTLTQRS